jgi:3-dehydroquinate dehydratase
MTDPARHRLCFERPQHQSAGIREPHIYGHETLADINARLVTQGESWA